MELIFVGSLRGEVCKTTVLALFQTKIREQRNEGAVGGSPEAREAYLFQAN